MSIIPSLLGSAEGITQAVLGAEAVEDLTTFAEGNPLLFAGVLAVGAFALYQVTRRS